MGLIACHSWEGAGSRSWQTAFLPLSSSTLVTGTSWAGYYFVSQLARQAKPQKFSLHQQVKCKWVRWSSPGPRPPGYVYCIFDIVLLMLSGNCGYSVQQNLGWDKIIEANTRTVTWMLSSKQFYVASLLWAMVRTRRASNEGSRRFHNHGDHSVWPFFALASRFPVCFWWVDACKVSWMWKRL